MGDHISRSSPSLGEVLRSPESQWPFVIFARETGAGTHRVRSPRHNLHSELAQFTARPTRVNVKQAEWVVLQRDLTQGSVTLPQYIRPLLLCVCLEAYSQSSNGLSSTWTVASSPSPVTPLCAHLAASQPHAVGRPGTPRQTNSQVKSM